MEIRHNSYFDGKVQSLAFVENGKTVMSVGLVLPGEYNFGTIERHERITVNTGQLYINGRWFSPGDTEVVLPGKQVMVMATELSFYTCLYG